MKLVSYTQIRHLIPKNQCIMFMKRANGLTIIAKNSLGFMMVISILQKYFQCRNGRCSDL